MSGQLPAGVQCQHRILALAKERGVFGITPEVVRTECQTNREFNCMRNVRYHLTRAGVARVILVAYEHDTERLLLMWTKAMSGQKCR